MLREPRLFADVIQRQRVQALLNANARTPDFQQNVSPLAGFLKCGDCGRAMVKTTWGGKTFYTCGSYKRYGASVCSKHSIAHDVVAKVVLDDLNRLMAAVENLRQLAQQGAAQEQALQAQLDKLRGSVQDDPLSLPWVKELLASGQLAELDRPTVAAAIREIRVYEGNRVEIDYLLPEAAALCWRGECMAFRFG